MNWGKIAASIGDHVAPDGADHARHPPAWPSHLPDHPI